VQKQYLPVMFVRIYRATELRVNRFKVNIEIDIKEIALVTTWNENNLFNI
jgi:hypothetical protein